MQKVKRITLNGDWMNVAFDGIACSSWFVKNFSSDDIYVSLCECIRDTDACFCVPSKLAEEVFISTEMVERTDGIWIKGSGDVEVEAISWRPTI